MLYHCKGLILEGNDRSEDDRISSSLSATATELTPSKFLPAAAVWSALGTLNAPASSAPQAESVGLPTPLELRASITTGAHRVLAPLMFVSKLRLGSI